MYWFFGRSITLPMSFVEGMTSGLAVIATLVGSVEDIIVDRNNRASRACRQSKGNNRCFAPTH